jgi:hypothetical protein
MRLLNGFGTGLRRLGWDLPRLDTEGMIAAAERRTGLADWGDPAFREGLGMLVRSFAAGRVHTFGRLYFREFCIRTLVNRLRIHADLARHPEILEVPIRRPLFVTGLPRSGTTLLHRLLSEDPVGRPLYFWETLEPSPPPMREAFHTDPRIARARKAVRTLNALAPRIPAAHLFGADLPEECNNLFAHAFVCGMLGFMFDVPEYVEWLGEQALFGPYRFLRRQLQLLSWHCAGEHWLLKSPAHLFGLDALLGAFPDACIVQTHRPPTEVVPSLCSLAAGFRGIASDWVDLRRLGSEMTDVFARGAERAIAVRSQADPARFLDVAYTTLVADPVEVVATVCRHFDYPFGTEFEARVRRHLAENPQHKHGVHRYSLDQFGLTPEVVNERFARYLDWLSAKATCAFS